MSPPHRSSGLAPLGFQLNSLSLAPRGWGIMRLVGAKFVWPGLCKDAKAWATACGACQCAKVNQHTKTPLEPFLILARQFASSPPVTGWTVCIGLCSGCGWLIRRTSMQRPLSWCSVNHSAFGLIVCAPVNGYTNNTMSKFLAPFH